MTENEAARRKLGEIDRLLNDPTVPFDPALIWSLLSEVAPRLFAAPMGRKVSDGKPETEKLESQE